jgi:carboxyl-terminal processing protease
VSPRSNADFTSATKDVKRLIDELKKEEIDGLIVDIRGNGGGHLSEATALSGLFINNINWIFIFSSHCCI